MSRQNEFMTTSKGVDPPNITLLTNLTAQEYTTNVILGMKETQMKHNEQFSALSVTKFTFDSTNLLNDSFNHNYKLLPNEIEKQCRFTTILPLAEVRLQKIFVKSSASYTASTQILHQVQKYQIAKQNSSVSQADSVGIITSSVENIFVRFIETLSKKMEVSLNLVLRCKRIGLDLELGTTVKCD